MLLTELMENDILTTQQDIIDCVLNYLMFIDFRKSTLRTVNCDKQIYCPECSGDRKVTITPHYSPKALNSLFEKSNGDYPALFELRCTQCGMKFYVLVYENVETKVECVIITNTKSGVASKNTSKGVSHYLEEAFKSKQVGAKSASLSMYRAALEFLLYEQGFTMQHLAPKIAALEKAAASGTSKEWMKRIDTEVLKIINYLGNWSIHPNDGDISRQETIKDTVFIEIEYVFRMLLEEIYEIPKRRAQSKRNLEEAKKRISSDQTDS